MADIFISYSSLDREKAEQLTELLTSAGLSVWIDRSDIAAASSWTAEIVDAINNCKVLVALLSPSSIESHNVIKEISLASEKRKKILPLDLEPVSLPRELEYQLAGIQRAPMTNIDAIIRALAKLGLTATAPPQLPVTRPISDSRTSLIILPFEDLSPAQDNLWFADGLAGELIDALSHIKSLRILDRKTSRDLRGVKQSTVEIGKLFDTRYFIEGSVRKFGDQIKISVSLLDIETADYLWQESIKGVMDDIFEIQEKVAAKVVDALKLHLTREEDTLVKERGTANAAAYELYLRSGDYYDRQTKEGFHQTIRMCEEAIRLDPHYVNAHVELALSHIALYQSFELVPEHLTIAEDLCTRIDSMEPHGHRSAYPRVLMAEARGDLDTAERIAREFVRQAPKRSNSHFTIAGVLTRRGHFQEAVEEYIIAHQLQPQSIITIENLIGACDQAKDHDRRKQWSERLLPELRKQLLLHPDNPWGRLWEALALCFVGDVTEARNKADTLAADATDPSINYNIAVLYEKIGDEASSFRAFKRALDGGFRSEHLISSFLRDFVSEHSTSPECAEARVLIEQFERETGAKPNG